MKEKFLQQLGARIRDKRKEIGLSQTELAEAIKPKTVQQAIARIENGTVNTSIYSLKSICKVLEIELDDLLKGL